VIAFVTVQMSGSGQELRSSQTELPEELELGTPQPKESDVPAAARKVAGEFILAAAGREDLVKAWKITHPDLKKQCACSYEEWLTGNIPVVYFPTKGLQGAAFAVTEVTDGRVILSVSLTPAKNSETPTSAFFIGLKEVGQGSSAKWLVDYWAPYVGIPVPNAPSSGG
jgi:hypothetical protein